jgi:hypothetical protein
LVRASTPCDAEKEKAWIPGPSPGMTMLGDRFSAFERSAKKKAGEIAGLFDSYASRA